MTFIGVTAQNRIEAIARPMLDALTRCAQDWTAKPLATKLRLEAEIARRKDAEAERDWLRAQIDTERTPLVSALSHPPGAMIPETPLGQGPHFDVSTLHDLLERPKAEVRKAELLRRLVTLQEEERHRIARELHDQMGQHVAALLLVLESLRGHTADRPAAADALHLLRELANQMGRDAHRIALELRPPALDDWGLETALTNYAAEWSRRSSIVVQLHCTGIDTFRLPPAVETALYRIAQEALTNVLKHAQATRVSVIVERRDDHVLAIVEDNGRGFDSEAVSAEPDGRRPLGLLGMEERVTQLGGLLEVESSPGNGTSLFMRIPLPCEAATDHG